ncbi:MAG: hypothetical protein H6876_02570 [Hyphomicrobiaceae bacterium]|nr:hypothetical protein [Hyphomicrobiaceae bacterium]
MIDEPAQDRLEAASSGSRASTAIIDIDLPDACRSGTYVTPAVTRSASLTATSATRCLADPDRDHFQRGHIGKGDPGRKWPGYGLTLSVHSRIEAVAELVSERARVGNITSTRNQMGAVPGVAAIRRRGFLTGAGPKAGGPWMLPALATERVVSVDTTAAGGNALLLSGAEPGDPGSSDPETRHATTLARSYC